MKIGIVKKKDADIIAALKQYPVPPPKEKEKFLKAISNGAIGLPAQNDNKNCGNK